MRSFGILLHISSLPSAYGIGDLGPAAHAFASAAAAAGARVWQFLPVHPTSTFIGNSPYSSPSAFAGNPLFISPELLVQDGYAKAEDLESAAQGLPAGGLGSDSSRVDFAAVTLHRERLLQSVFERNCGSLSNNAAYRDFCRTHAGWLRDYARFVTIKACCNGAPWTEWPEPLRLREAAALEAWDKEHALAVEKEQFIQFLFFSQWRSLREACSSVGLQLLGDVPIYVTHDSADVWAAPQYFKLEPAGRPAHVSGVPPDYYSETGQRWGTPVYRWDVLESEDFGWWKKRLGHALLLADMVRLDHFRGYCGYWEIPAEEETAVKGVWRKAPGTRFLRSLKEHFGELPVLAEDLGIITADVRAAMAEYGLPGMHVLQFAFSGDMSRKPDIPHKHSRNSFVYTGTHDNPPTRVWFDGADENERGNIAAYSGVHVFSEAASGVMTRLAFASVADCAVLPMQDVLNLGEEGRMNTPGVAQGNWGWRMKPEEARPERFEWVTGCARIFGRLPDPAGEPVEDEESLYED